MAVSTATAKNSASPLAATAGKRQSELASLIGRNIDADGVLATAIPRLFLMRASQLTEPLPTVYEPALCIVAQGRKQVMLADEVYFYGPEQCLVITVDLPAVGQVIEETPAEPYLCLRLELDPGQLSVLMMESGQDATRNQRAERLKLGLSVSAIDPG